MAARKKPPSKRRQAPPEVAPARSPVGRSPARAGKERDALGRLQSALDEDLFARLCETHRTGRDFRNATALRCGVHPKMLTRWLEQGARDADGGGLQARLFLEFGRIEGDIRADWIAEVANPEASREETGVDDDGQPISRSIRRTTTGVQWLLERRFKQFRADWIPRPDEAEVGDLLVQQQTAFSPEAAMAVVRAMVASMPPELAGPYLNWARARLPAGATIDGSNEQG